MTRTRKISALVLLVAMVFSLAACTGTENGGEREQITLNIPPVEDLTDVDTSAIPGLEDGVLTVGMECAYAPYNWSQLDDSNGAVPIENVPGAYANGYDVMVAKRVCDAYGWELKVRSSVWDSLIPGVQSGVLDAIIAGQSMTADRMTQVDMAGPYYYATIVCLTGKDGPYGGAQSIRELAGGRCTAQSGTIWYDSCLPQIPRAEIQAPSDDAPAMLMALETGTVDFVCTDMPTAMGACAKNDRLTILDFNGTTGDFQFASEEERAENVNIGISVKKGNTDLRDAMDRVLSSMTTDDFNAIMDAAIAVQPSLEGGEDDDGLLGKLTGDMAGLATKYWRVYLGGMRDTLVLALVATAIGCVIGLACGILNTIPVSKGDSLVKRFFLKLIRAVIRIYVEVFRGTPMILQAVFIFYGLPYLSGGAYRFESLWTAAILIVSINTGAYMAESVRGGILSVDPGQTEGAMAIGMNHVQTMLYVILPQALRNILPQIGNNFIINVKDTSVMSVIGFTEFFGWHRYIVGVEAMFFPSATIEMLGYLSMTLLASILLRWLEKRLDGTDSYELVQGDALTMTCGTYNHPDRGTPFREHNREHSEEDQ